MQVTWVPFPGLGRSPGGGNGNPFQYSCLENPHGQRSLTGYSPWSRKSGTRHSEKTSCAFTHVCVNFYFLLQGISLTQGWNLGLLHCRKILYCLSHQGSPVWEGLIQSIEALREKPYVPQGRRNSASRQFVDSRL